MKSKITRILVILSVAFLFLFTLRLLYGYTKKFEPVSYRNDVQFSSNVSFKKNYASAKYKKSPGIGTSNTIKIDQKYEKIADINTKSSKFEKEEKLIRKNIKANNALIQFEQKNGNKGNRHLQLMIGVPPNKFEELYATLIKIGKVESKRITKTDKTNEYKELNAKKASLEKTRSSLIELKSKGGKINEYMQLENRILDIENQLQALGVNLGDFDDENEFCTVKFSLNEGVAVKISIAQRLKVAFEWTVKMSLKIMMILFFMSLFAYMLLLIIDKTKLLQSIIKKINS